MVRASAHAVLSRMPWRDYFRSCGVFDQGPKVDKLTPRFCFSNRDAGFQTPHRSADPAQNWKFILPAGHRNPEIISGDRLSGLPQLNVDSCLLMWSLLGGVQHRAVDDRTVQPVSVPSLVPRLGCPVAILSDDYHWECQLWKASQDPLDARMFLCGCRQCVCIQDQPCRSVPHIPGLTTSNARSR